MPKIEGILQTTLCKTKKTPTKMHFLPQKFA